MMSMRAISTQIKCISSLQYLGYDTPHQCLFCRFIYESPSPQTSFSIYLKHPLRLSLSFTLHMLSTVHAFRSHSYVFGYNMGQLNGGVYSIRFRLLFDTLHQPPIPITQNMRTELMMILKKKSEPARAQDRFHGTYITNTSPVYSNRNQ